MSKSLGEAALRAIVNNVLEKSPVLKQLQKNYRDKLNSKYHILDLRFDALYSANVKSKSAKEREIFSRAYHEFISTIESLLSGSKGRIFNSPSDIDQVPVHTFFIRSPAMLVSPTFRASRENITKVSKLIPKNKYFGLSNRARTLGEVLREERKTVEELLEENRAFDAETGTELVLDKETGKLVPRNRTLSKVDLGHTPGVEEGRDTPLGEQLLGAASTDILLDKDSFKDIELYSKISELSISQANESIGGLILSKLSELADVQASCVVSFKNEYPENLLQKLSARGGFLTLTLQLYNVNNDISVKESEIRNKLLAEIKEAILNVVLDVPGSNTLKQDIVEAVRNRIIEGISGKGSTSKLKKHDSLRAPVKSKKPPTKKPGAATGKLSVAVGTKVPKTPPGSQVKSGVNLSNLQSIISAQLQDVISANMGDGDRHDVLNYRTGRFASSVKVERLSQSRAGMITAFYSYMKNPYATFSQGGKQSSPKTRDPKLLISRSIREIAAEQAVTRMRAVAL